MRSTMLAAAALASFVAGLGLFACRERQQPQVAPLPSAERAVPTVREVASAPQPAASAAPAPDAGPTDELDSAVREAMACTSPTAVIVNHPDGGTVFNNAMTSADAGFIDRTQGVLDAIAAKRDTFRCCFDPWIAEAPGAEGTALLRLALEPDGKVRSAEVDRELSDIGNAVTLRCVAEVARSLDYPESPTGKETLVEYPFRVTAPH